MKLFSKKLNLDIVIKPSVFQSHLFVNDSPDMIQYAAYYGSINVFKYLLDEGAQLAYEDKSHNTIIHFTTAGNHEIILNVLEEKEMFEESMLHIATLYHHNELFHQLSTKFSDIPVYNELFQTVLHQASYSNNIKIKKN